MDKKMFCFQCEQTVGCAGCTGNAGVCGQDVFLRNPFYDRNHSSTFVTYNTGYFFYFSCLFLKLAHTIPPVILSPFFPVFFIHYIVFFSLFSVCNFLSYAYIIAFHLYADQWKVL